MLAALVAVPLAVVAYRRALSRRRRRTEALAGQGLVFVAKPGRRGIRRHIPFTLFAIALGAMVVALARPSVNLAIPRREGKVVLAFDVSNSMLADDLTPTRMEAARSAARGFVERQPSTIEIGVVAFGDGGLVALLPTRTKSDVLAAIDRLSPQGGTSLGKGIFTSLSAIAEQPISISEEELAGDLEDIDIGYYGNAAIVLLTDGENTADPDPVAMAQLASVAGVKVHTIGVGSEQGAVVEIDGFSIATALDVAMLAEIAKVSGGTFALAEDEETLAAVYDSIDLKFVREGKKTEVTALFAGIAAVLLLTGGILSMVWFGRVA
jgi:Ca-activated chloride channel family protein